jgi:hypothetical protein
MILFIRESKSELCALSRCKVTYSRTCASESSVIRRGVFALDFRRGISSVEQSDAVLKPRDPSRRKRSSLDNEIKEHAIPRMVQGSTRSL